MSTLSAKGLVKAYRGRRVVDGVDVELRKGEVVGMLGPNGAGKTTTFYMVVGLIRPDEGRVFLGDEDVTSLAMFKRARMGITYLPQEPSVFRKLTVEDNLRAIVEVLEGDRAELDEKMESLITDFKLSHIRKSMAYALSGGERRRVEIARALLTAPDFMLLDEPFAGIDPIAVVDIQNIVKKMKDAGIGIMISDHNVRETLGACDRAYILSDGKILEEGPPEQIANSQRAREIYLGEKFRL
jgi:lipopolysaccharide export system ATP-binding protein